MGFSGRFSGRYVSGFSGARFAPVLRSTFLFDGGLHKPQRAVIQDAAVLLLERLLIVNGGYLEAVEATDCMPQSADDTQEIGDMITQLGTRMPAVLVAVGDGEHDTAGDIDRWTEQIEVHVYFLNANARSRMARVTRDIVAEADPKADPGVWVAMEHARMLLCGQKPGAKTQLHEFRPRSTVRIGTDGDFLIWEQIYSVRASIRVDLKRDLTLELQRIDTYNRLAEQASSDDPIVTTETEVTE